jgi:hypothetical protein
MTNTISKLSQFIFPILAVICFSKGLAGKYTIQTIICFLIAGFLFSMYLIFSKKLILWGMINITLTVLLIIGGLFLYFAMISYGV